MKKKKSDSDNRLYTMACIIPVIAASLIALTNIAYVLGVLVFDLTAVSADECMSANVISIMGIVVSFWVGISITNNLDRKTIRNTKEDVKIIKEGLHLTWETAKKSLLFDLYQNDKNAMSHWIARQIEIIHEGEIDGNVFIRLEAEEKFYCLINNKQIGLEAEELESRYEECNKAVLDALPRNGKDADLIKKIMQIRKVEVQFMIGYMLPPDEGIFYFEKAAAYYDKTQENFPIKSAELDKIYRIICETENCLDEKEILKFFSEHIKDLSLEDLRILAYVLNFIGETHSMIVFYRVKNSNLKSQRIAIWFCRLAIIAAREGRQERETYYRNYGCAIERVCKANNENELKKEALEKAEQQYIKAMKCDAFNEKLHECLCSLYNKQFQNASNKDWEREPKVEEFAIEYSEEIKKILNKYEIALNLYQHCCADKRDKFYVRKVLYLRDRYCVAAAEEKKQYAVQIQQCLFALSELRIRNKDDAFTHGKNICEKEKLDVPLVNADDDKQESWSEDNIEKVGDRKFKKIMGISWKYWRDILCSVKKKG